jgi:hypothetical protein
MTPLEAAQRLHGGNPFGSHGDDAGWQCPFCGMPSGRHSGFGDRHRSDCPSLALPAIVAALEAAEAVRRAYDRETVATWGVNLGSPLLAAVDALDKAMTGEGAA